MSRLSRILEKVFWGIAEGFIIAGILDLFDVLGFHFWWAFIIAGIAIIGFIIEGRLEKKEKED